MDSPSKIGSAIARLGGNLVKLWGSLYHTISPGKRWQIRSEGAVKQNGAGNSIPLIIWQTNFTDMVSLPMIANHRRNRRLAQEFEYRYVSTEEREQYLRAYAPTEVLAAYLRLTDGAAQADLWRCFVLYREGGVYMDIDASLVRGLWPVIQGRNQIFIRNYGEFTNFFMATRPNNPIFKEFLDEIVKNIREHTPANSKGVYGTTGPGALKAVLERHPEVQFVAHQKICVQGAFTNEHFQYIDRPRSKWTYKKTFME